jgi:hypothetical protein
MFPEEDRIRARAHRIWEDQGRLDGLAETHWRMAQEEIAIEDNQALTLLPNPIAAGKVAADGTEDAEPFTAAEEAFGDSGPDAQGEQPP